MDQQITQKGYHTCCASELSRLAIGKDADTHGLSGAVGDRNGPAHLLVPPPGVCPEVESHLHRLIKARICLRLIAR